MMTPSLHALQTPSQQGGSTAYITTPQYQPTPRSGWAGGLTPAAVVVGGGRTPQVLGQTPLQGTNITFC
jgi:hypothetical protein